MKNWPWNVRVTPIYPIWMEPGDEHLAQPEYFTVEIRFRGQWLDAGTARSWWAAFFQGIAS